MDGVLWINSEQAVHDDWFCTDDLVRENKGTLYYEGRVNRA